MKRSFVNEVIRRGDAFMRSFGVILPPFAYWTPELMRGAEARIIRDRRMGWDITDYGEGRFDELGLMLFTARNGVAGDLAGGRGMLYAEKLMIARQGQLSPMHRHDVKAGDIINRGGGSLVTELFAPDAEGGIDREAEVAVPTDGCERRFAAGGHPRLTPGESVTLLPGIWHAFRAEGGDCLIGEVSTVNDDETDNVFEKPIARFVTIQEDCPALHFLVSDY